MIRGLEFHEIVQNVFNDVRGVNESEQIQVNCPRCQERDGLAYPDGKYNLEINTAKRVFRCWKCDEPKFSGSLKRLIRLYGSKTDYQLYKSYSCILGDDFNYNEDDDEIIVKLPDEMIYFSQMDASNPAHFEAYNYMINDRLISRDIILKYRIGFCVEGKYEKRIIIPSYDENGDVNYFVARSYNPNSKKKYMNPKIDKNKIIFNEGYINWDSTIYMVEGPFEMLSFPVNCLTLLGKDIFESTYNKIREIKPNIVILLDPDAFKSSVEIFFKLQSIYTGKEDKLKIIKLPRDGDLDELRRNYSHDELLKSLYSARPLTIEDYFIKNLYNENEYRWKRRYPNYSKYFEWK